MRVPVSIEFWQLECCGAAFAVGDEVEWTLLFQPGDADPEALVTLDLVATPTAAAPGAHPVTLTAGGLRLFWLAPQRLHGAVRLRGAVREDHHGTVPEDHPGTAGRIRRIRLISREGGGPPRYRDLDRAPRAFRQLPGAGPGETGLLVDLTVPG